MRKCCKNIDRSTFISEVFNWFRLYWVYKKTSSFKNNLKQKINILRVTQTNSCSFDSGFFISINTVNRSVRNVLIFIYKLFVMLSHSGIDFQNVVFSSYIGHVKHKLVENLVNLSNMANIRKI